MLTCIFLYVDMSFLLTWMLKFWVHVDMHSQQRRQPLGSHYLTYFYCTNRERKFRYSCSLHTVQNASGGAQGVLPFAIHTQAWSSPRVEGLRSNFPVCVDMCCRIKNASHHTGECMSTCSFLIRKRGCVLTYEQKHAT